MRNTIIKHITLLILLLAFTTSSQILQAQNNKMSKRAEAAVLKKADVAYQNQSYAIAAVYYESYLSSAGNSQTVELTKLADCYWKMREYNDALRVYQLLFPEGNEHATKQQQLRIGELYARFGQYEEASEWIGNVKGYQAKANVYKAPERIDEMKKDSLDWRLGFLNINTSHREFSPYLADSVLYFSSNMPLKKRKRASGWDGDSYTRIWKVPVSDLHDMNEAEINASQSTAGSKGMKTSTKSLAGVYEGADTKPLLNELSTQMDKRYVSEDNGSLAKVVQGLNGLRYNAGAIAIDKNSHFYFSTNYPNAENGVNRIRLMEGVNTPSGITKKHALPFGDPKSYSVMHPAVNQEGTILVFSSDKPDGRGGCDLYYSKRDNVDSKWGPLMTFDESINTLGNEVFPSITPDGMLYFSSDLLPGLGGLDIFRIPLADAIAGTGEVEHLGYPVNSSSDDFGWTQDTAGSKGYFTSDRKNTNDNLYSFYYKVDNSENGTTPSAVKGTGGSANNGSVIKGTSVHDITDVNRTVSKSYIEGYVLDKITLKPIVGSTVFLLNKLDNKVYIAKTDENGKYRFVSPEGDDFTIKAISTGYTNDCYAFNATDILDAETDIQKVPQDLLLGKYIIGKKWKLNNIHYDFDKANIRPDARPILDSLIAILKMYPITAELGSHTDSRGSNEYNQRLSQHRADAAVAYLVEHGIARNRITAKGYGETQLLNKCADGVKCSEAAHQANRRTEVKVTGYVMPGYDEEQIDPNQYKDGQQIYKDELPDNFFDDCNRDKDNSQNLIQPNDYNGESLANNSSTDNKPVTKPSKNSIRNVQDHEIMAMETITPGGRFALFARQYYGCRDFWGYIYEANKDHISNPDNVPIGTVIKIPKLPKELIDKNNPECIRKALELDNMYLGKK